MLVLINRKQKGKSKSKKDRNGCIERNFVILTLEDILVELFRERALKDLDPSKDANCQFSVICFFLKSIGIQLQRSPEKLRRDIVRYLEKIQMTRRVFP